MPNTAAPNAPPLPGRTWSFLVVAAVCTSAVIIWRWSQTYALPLVDLSPLYYGAQAWLRTGNAYDLRAVIPPEYATDSMFTIGNGYPLPAVLLLLPLSFLPAQLAATVWLALITFSLLLGLHLNRAPWWFLLYVPLFEAFWLQQYMLLMVVVQLFALWAYRERRHWVLACCCTLLLTKPTGGILAVTLALLARNWRQQLLVITLVWGGTTLLDPNWPLEWLQALQVYQVVARKEWLWPLLILVLPLLWWRDYINAAVLAQVSLVPLAAVYDASSLPLGLMHDRRSWVLSLCSFAYGPIATMAGRPIGIGVALVIPMVALSFVHHYPRMRRWVRSPPKGI